MAKKKTLIKRIKALFSVKKAAIIPIKKPASVKKGK